MNTESHAEVGDWMRSKLTMATEVVFESSFLLEGVDILAEENVNGCRPKSESTPAYLCIEPQKLHVHSTRSIYRVSRRGESSSPSR